MSAKADNPLLKLALDFAPLLVFFAVNGITGSLFQATAATIAATVVALAMSKLLLGHVSALALVSAALVVGFGGLTLWLNDADFIKMKPTILYLGFAVVLGVGIATRRPFLKFVIGEAFPNMPEAGWAKLSRNWLLFFLAMAVTNEAVWRNFSDDVWVNYKVWGATTASIAFALAQAPLLARWSRSDTGMAEPMDRG